MDWLMNLFGGIGKAAQGAGQSIAQGAGNIAKSASGFLPNMAGMFGSGASSAGAQAGQGAVNAFNQGTNVAQTAGKAATSAMPSVGTSQTPMNSFQSVAQIKNPFQQSGSGVQNQMASAGARNAPGANLNPFSAFQPTKQVAQQSGVAPQLPQPATTPAATPPTAKPALGGMFGQNPMQTAMGMGMPMAMQMFSSQPKVPDLSQLPSYQAMKNVSFNSFKEMDPALETALNNDLKKLEDDELEQMQMSYKNLRPGADIESDSKYAQDTQDLRDKQASRRMDLMAKARFESIQQQIGANQQEMAKLVQLANMDTQQIGIQLGIDAQAAQNFQELFGSLGRSMVSGSYGLNQPATQPMAGGVK